MNVARIGATILSALLVAAYAQADPAPAELVSLSLIGLRTDVTYAPFVEFANGAPAPTPNTCGIECRTVPAQEWLRATVKAASNVKVDLTVCYYDCARPFSFTESTEGDGTASFLLPPARPGETDIRIFVEQREGPRAEARYAVAGVLPKDPREVSLTPVNGWAEFNLTVEAGEYFVAVLTERLPTVSDAHPFHEEPPADATWTDLAGTRNGIPFASVRYHIAAHDMDVRAEASQGIATARLRIPTMDLPSGGGPSMPLSVQGTFTAGGFSVGGVIARAGAQGGPAVGLLAFSPTGTGIVFDTKATGPFHAYGPHLDGGIGASGAAIGPTIGTMRATAETADGFILAGVGMGLDSQGHAVIRHNNDEITRLLGPGEAFGAIREGPCAGSWSVAAESAISPSGGIDVVLAYGEGLGVSEFARRVFAIPGACTL